MNKVRNVIFSLIISAILFSIPVYFLAIKDRPKYSALEYRQYATFLTPSVDRILKGAFQSRFETALSDQFPGRNCLVSANFAFNRQVAGAAYALTGDKAVPLTGKSGSPMLYRADGTDLLLPQPQMYSKAYDSEIIKQAAAFKDIMRKNSDVNFNIYLIENINSSAVHPASPYYPESAHGQFADVFTDNTPSGLNVRLFRLKSFDEYKRYYFKTDHHWNGDGAWKVYNDVYDMLAQKWPDIGERLVNRGFRTYGMVKFRGTYSREAAYQNVYDIIKEPTADLPEYTVFINGTQRPRSEKAGYFNGNFNRDTFYNHYAAIFGLDYGLAEYKMQNAAKRNLLIIGPSYKQTMEVLIASHYANTYAVDLRYYERDMKKAFDLTGFITENKINDVLFIIEPQSFISKEWQVR